MRGGQGTSGAWLVNMKRFALIALVLVACGKDVKLAATYSLERIECGDIVLVPGSFQERIMFTGSGTAKYVSSTDTCRHEDTVDYTLEGSEFTYAVKKTECFHNEPGFERDTADCSLDYTVADIRLSRGCGDGVKVGKIQIEGDGTELAAVQSVGSVTCRAVYR